MIRLARPESQANAAPLPWTWAALTIATLFLNFVWFGFGLQGWIPGSLAHYAGLAGAQAILLTLLFFLGPALASQSSGRPLLDVVEASLGAAPAWVIRACCAWSCIDWIAVMAGVPARNFLPFMLRHEPSRWTSVATAVCLVAFLLWTGLQDAATGAKLALFSGKLTLAVLAAALIRVREGLPWVLEGLPSHSDYSPALQAAQGFSTICFDLGPMVFLAADLGSRVGGKRQTMLTGAIGVVLPFAAIQVLTAVTELATGRSSYYTPSLEPTVAMALWSKVAGSAAATRMMVVAITTFGAARFGVRALRSSMPGRFGPGIRGTILVVFGVLIVCCVVRPFEGLTISAPLPAGYLAATAAVVTAEFLAGSRLASPARSVDWIGLTAFATGMTVALCVEIPHMDSWHSGLLLGYGTALAVCFLGRLMQRAF